MLKLAESYDIDNILPHFPPYTNNAILVIPSPSKTPVTSTIEYE